MKINESHRRAFSLMELLVVLAIMSILSLIAVGAYSNFRQARRIRFAAESVSTTFVTARSFAVTTNGTYRVVFQYKDPQTGAESFSYWIDETYANDVNPALIGIVTPSQLPAARRPKVTTPATLPTSIRITDIVTTPAQTDPPAIGNPGQDYTPADYSMVVVRFFPDGSSDDAAVYFLDTASNLSDARRYYTTKLYGITAKPKIFADTKQP